MEEEICSIENKQLPNAATEHVFGWYSIHKTFKSSHTNASMTQSQYRTKAEQAQNTQTK